MRYTFEQLAALTGAEAVRWHCPEGPLQPVNDLDRTGPDTVYFPRNLHPVTDRALRSLRQRGVLGVALAPRQRTPAVEAAGLGLMLVPDPAAAFVKLGADARAQSHSFIAGVTGTSGKSSVTELLAAVLRTQYRVQATPYSRNVIHDSAAALLEGDGGADEAVVLEMGFGQVGDIEAMAALARPHAGIITNVSAAHLDGAKGSRHLVALEKGRLGAHVEPDGIVIVHADDPGSAPIRSATFAARMLTFGSGPDTDAGWERVRIDECGTTFTLRLLGQRAQVRLPMIGRFQAANATAAALAAHAAGVSVANICAGLAAAPVLRRRFEVHSFERGLTLVDDTWNASTDATLRGLENAAALAGPRRRAALLSDIAYLGRVSADHHRIIGQHAVTCGFSDLLLFADARTAGIREGAIAAGMPAERIHDVAEADGVPEALMRVAGADTLIYCKARQGYSLGPQIDRFRSRLRTAGWELVAVGGADAPCP